MAKEIQLTDTSGTKLYPLTANRSYSYRGIILNAINSEIEARGTVMVIRMPSGLWRLDFVAKITTASTNSTDFSFGLDADVFKDVVNVTPSAPSGYWQLFNSSGSFDTASSGYGNEVRAGANSMRRWQLGRIYNDSAAFGAWAPSHYKVGDYIQGFCYGI